MTRLVRGSVDRDGAGDPNGRLACVARSERDRSAVEPVQLSDSLELLQRYLGTARPSSISVLEDNWRQIIGVRLADSCELRSLHHGRLVIRSDDPGVAEQLRWMAGDLRAAANSVIGSDDVAEVEVRLGSG